MSYLHIRWHLLCLMSDVHRYEMEFLSALDTESLYIPHYFSPDREQRHLTVRQGVKVVLQQEGRIGRFDFQARAVLIYI